MKTLPYKIIFIDIDCTLLSHTRKPPRFDNASIRYLRKLQKRGIKIVISTARPFHSVQDIKIMEKLYPDGLILSSGALTIFDNQIIHEEDLTNKDFETLAKIAIEHKGNLEGIRTYDSFLIREMNDPVKYVFEAYPSRIPSIEGIHRQKVNKATIYFYKENYEKIAEKLPKHLHYFRFHDCAIDISAKTTTKGVAVKRLLNELSISSDEAVAIGDEFSDATMFKEVKFSVAMDNAPLEVKSSAKYVTKHVDKHGVKFALKHLIK